MLAADYGGVLHWTQYLAVLVILLAGLLVLPSALLQQRSLRPNYLLLLLLIWAAYAWSQTIPLPRTLVGWLSPATASAYGDWISPFVKQPDQGWFPISLDIHGSRHAAAILTALAAFVWAAGQILNTRPRIGTLLLILAVGVGLHAAFGFWCLVDPVLAATSNSGFGSFVNRNNAALFLNLGLAASLGLLSWRLYALTGQEVDDGSFEFNDLFSLINDRDSIIGVAGSALCLGGLLACGSRGGVAAALVGGLLAFGWMRQRRGWITIPVVGAAIGISLLLLIVPLDLGMKSVDRINQTASQEKASMLHGHRLQHWSDGWSAAKSHLPAGSGMATYAYAYLPHQQSSPEFWFHHADNLWLELIVEQGIIGLLLAACFMFLMIRALLRLAKSADPIDQGLRTTGWFTLGVIAFSQSLDFGLIIPANLFLFAVILTAIVSRSAEVSPPEKDDAAKRSLFAPRWQRPLTLATAFIALICTAACLPKLKHDAVCETAYRTVDAQLDQIAGDDNAMDKQLQWLHAMLDWTSHPAVLAATAKLEHRRARLAEVIESDPPSMEDVAAAYRNTSPAIRRLRWNDRDQSTAEPKLAVESEVDSIAGYRRSLDLSTRIFVQLPLSIEARAAQVYLDFIHRDIRRTQSALQQLATLQTRDPDGLIKLAILAADGGELEIAKAQWKKAIAQKPHLTHRAIEFVQSRSDVTLDDVIPNLPENQRRTAWYLLANADNDPVLKAQAPEFLQRALEKVDCQACDSKRERADCEELCGDILYSLDRTEDSFQHYVTAIEEQPADPNLRVKLIGRLRYAGKKEAALLAARRARRALPKQPRFQQIIDAMAAQDLRDAAQRRSKAAGNN